MESKILETPLICLGICVCVCVFEGSGLRAVSLRVHVPNNWVPRVLVIIIIIVQLFQNPRYTIIGYMDMDP